MTSPESATAIRSMTTDRKNLIKLEGITKVFLTDEVETHALSGIHLDILQGDWQPRRGAAE